MFTLCCWIDQKTKLELGLMAASVLLKIKFGHAEISVPKIGILMSKTACIILWWLSLLHNFIQQSLNSDSVQVQILLPVCRKVAMVRISDKAGHKAWTAFFS